MSEQNKKIARRLFDEMWNRANFAVVDELVPSSYDGHSSAVIHGPDGAKAFIVKLREAFPDFSLTIVDQVAEGDKVAMRWTAYGTHKGEFQGIPATNRQVSVSGITILRVLDGKIIEGWTNEDMLGFLRQLGIVPGTEQA
jgi:steroid delta-isomerase-like uncharacterized protein